MQINDYQYLDFISNKTILCPIKSQWIHFEEYFLSFIGLLITFILTIKIHFIEIRFNDYYALFRCYTISLILTIFYFLTFVFNNYPNEYTCKYEQILIQYCFILFLTNIFLLNFYRLFKNKLQKKMFCWFFINLLFQTILTIYWLYKIKKNNIQYHYQLCYNHLQIHLCLYDKQPLIFSTIFLPILFLFTAFNVYVFTKPFAIAQLLEAILLSIGLLMSGSMWYMNLLFSNYSQIPYKYIAYVILLTYMMPR